MDTKRWVGLAGVACGAVALLAQGIPMARAQSVKAVSEHRCSIGGSDRFVHIELRNGGEDGCGVIYEKRTEGEAPRQIWGARKDLAFCADKLASTLGKLTAGGWACGPTGGEMLAHAHATAADRALPRDGAPLADQAMPGDGTPVADRVMPRKEAPPSAAPTPSTGAAPAAANTRSKASPPTAAEAGRPVAMAGSGRLALARPTGEFDDWIYRWDDEAREIVFTVYSTTDGRKVETRRWSPDPGGNDVRPSNIVVAQDAYAKQVLIVAWPDEREQRITVLDPLLQDKPICQISTRSDRESGWGYGVKDKALYLKGLQARNGNPADLVEFRETCDYTR